MTKHKNEIFDALENANHEKILDLFAKNAKPRVPIANALVLSTMFQAMYEQWVLTTAEEDEQHFDATTNNLGVDDNDQMQVYYSNYLWHYQQKYSTFGNLLIEHPKLFANLNVIHLYQFHRVCVALDQQEYARRQRSTWPADFRSLWELLKEAKTKCFFAIFELVPLRYSPGARAWFLLRVGTHHKKLAPRHQIYQVHDYITRNCFNVLNYTVFRNQDRIAKMKRLVPHFLPSHKNPLWGEQQDEEQSA